MYFDDTKLCGVLPVNELSLLEPVTDANVGQCIKIRNISAYFLNPVAVLYLHQLNIFTYEFEVSSKYILLLNIILIIFYRPHDFQFTSKVTYWSLTHRLYNFLWVTSSDSKNIKALE